MSSVRYPCPLIIHRANKEYVLRFVRPSVRLLVRDAFWCVQLLLRFLLQKIRYNSFLRVFFCIQTKAVHFRAVKPEYIIVAGLESRPGLFFCTVNLFAKNYIQTGNFSIFPKNWNHLQAVFWAVDIFCRLVRGILMHLQPRGFIVVSFTY